MSYLRSACAMSLICLLAASAAPAELGGEIRTAGAEAEPVAVIAFEWELEGF